MSNNKKSEVIALRVASNIKEDIKSRSDRLDLTMTDYILKAVTDDIEQDNSEEVEELQRDLEAVTSENKTLKDQLETVTRDYEQQEAKIANLSKQLDTAVESNNSILEGKDDRINDLKEQLQTTNQQLSNQQSLQLATVSRNEQLQLKLDTLEEDQKEKEEKQGFFSRIFNG